MCCCCVSVLPGSKRTGASQHCSASTAQQCSCSPAGMKSAECCLPERRRVGGHRLARRARAGRVGARHPEGPLQGARDRCAVLPGSTDSATNLACLTRTLEGPSRRKRWALSCRRFSELARLECVCGTLAALLRCTHRRAAGSGRVQTTAVSMRRQCTRATHRHQTLHVSKPGQRTLPGHLPVHTRRQSLL